MLSKQLLYLRALIRWLAGSRRMCHKSAVHFILTFLILVLVYLSACSVCQPDNSHVTYNIHVVTLRVASQADTSWTPLQISEVVVCYANVWG